tara:strand:+ start:285 stop:494 length:210 start_codon:yes stop_codon:yes gene_type:complete
MEINVNGINEIESKLEYRKPSTLVIKVHISEHQAQDLFNQLWEDYGTEQISKWLKSENYSLTKEVNNKH